MTITKDMIAKKLIEEAPRLKDTPVEKMPFIDGICETIKLAPELETNVIEWLNSQKLSDVYVGELTINKIMEALDAPFVFAIAEMRNYINRNCQHPSWSLTK